MVIRFWVFCSIAVATHATELASGHRISDIPIAALPATVYYAPSTQDNAVAATSSSATQAKQHGGGAVSPDDSFYSPQAASESSHAMIALRTFYSEDLGDTFTTCSPQGLRWAANTSLGYSNQRIEAYCLREQPSIPPSSILSVRKYVQYWSSPRKDTFLAASDGPHAQAALAAGYTELWTECYVVSTTIPGATGKWTTWEDRPQAGIPWPKSKDLLGWEYLSGANPGYGSGNHIGKSADTWYPSWAADGELYTSFTDGTVKDDLTGALVSSGSGGRAVADYNSTTGQAVIVGNDPFNLNVTQVKTFTSSTFPYQGRYPCGQLVYKGNWWYGTYYLDNPNATVGANYVGPSPDPDCGNWCVQGPLVSFRLSQDNGTSWHEPVLKASNGSDNLFRETAANNAKVKFGAPHWVDFGRELEHSPDGKAYIVGHGASRPEAIQAWMLGDEVYLARVNPDPESVADMARWEFYAGGAGAAAKWVAGDVTQAVPLVVWNNHTGVVTMTYMAGIRKYVLTVSTASYYPYMTKQFDTYFLESDSVTGPWSYVNYNAEFGPEAYFVHHPSKFLAVRANTTAKVFDAFLMYSANFAFHSGSEPPNSGYHMNLQQARFPLSDSFAARLAREYALLDQGLRMGSEHSSQPE